MTAPYPVHIAELPDPNALALLHSLLDPAITLSAGKQLPDPAEYRVLVSGRPQRAELEASPALEILLIPFAGLPAPTAALMRDFPQIAIHNLHHNQRTTAEMALALLMAAAKLLIPSDREFRQHDWSPRHLPYPSVQLYDKTALLLGYGAVGQTLAPMLRALGMHLRIVRRHAPDPAQHIYTTADLPALLPQANVVIVCLPGTPETRGLLGAAQLAALPRGAIVINVGRAEVLDQHALYDALKSGHLHAAGQDVWYSYPGRIEGRVIHPPAEVPFHELDNMVMSPHRAGGVKNEDVERNRMQAMADLLNAAAHGEQLPHRVDLARGY